FSNRSEQKLGRRVVDGLAEPFRIDGNDLNISASVGIVLFPEHGSSSQDLVKKADVALYDVKASSRNGYRLYSPALLDAVEEEKALEKRLHIALENNEFELHYQPIIDVGTRSVRAAEALVRWRDPVEGLVPPVRFIGVAERTGFILQLSEWIIGRACQDAMAWPSYIQLAVNVSALEFKRSNLFDVVLQALLRSGLSPERLQIEVTETALIESHPGQLRTFRQLKDMGFALVLDDFGTGYSSAAYVIDFPFDKIKIDKSFVQGLPKRECGAVIASAIALAKGMDITITAEGIETELQFGILSSMGIDFAQGYLFGRPVPAGQFSRQFSLNLKDRALTDCPEPLQLDHIEYLKNAV
ncbi:MAG: GGDEF domain-containing protein, partial [Alphaproteobacteria bacterium]